MARYAIVGPEVSGHLFPLCTLGHELQQRGHEGIVLGKPDAQRFADGANLGFQAYGATQFPPGSWNESLAHLGTLTGRKAIRFTIEQYVTSSRLVLDELPALLRELHIDGVIIDQTMLTAGTVAEHLQLPHISVACALLMNREPGVPPILTPWSYANSWTARLRNRLGYAAVTHALRPIMRHLDGVRKRWKLPVVRDINDRFSAVGQLAQIPREFDFPRQEMSPVMEYVGPLHSEGGRAAVAFPFEELTGRPLVYASLGTLQNRLQPVFQAIVTACRDLDVQLVLSAGGGDVGELIGNAPDTIVVPFAPQLELVKQAAVVITHAGLNTVMETLAQGVPVVCLPVTNDQPAVAARVEFTDCGLKLPLKHATADRIRTAVQTVLEDNRFRENARRLQQAIATAGGVTRAADLTERWL